MMISPPTFPQEVLKEGSPAAFGVFRERAESILKANNLPPDVNEWTSLCYALIEDDLKGGKKLERINQDRNDIAHGRESRAAEEIKDSIVEFLQKERWHQCKEKVGMPNISDLFPWISEAPQTEGLFPNIGLLDKWAKNRWTYLVPATGRSFKIPAPMGKQ